MQPPLSVESLASSGIRQIAITWVNHAGASLVKVVPLRQLQHAIDAGVGFSPVSDAFRTDGVIDPTHRCARPDGDLRLRADPASIAILDPVHGWAWAAGDRWERDRTAYKADQRQFCRRMGESLEDAGLSMTAGFELEWFLLTPVGNGSPQPVIPGGPYGADRLIEGMDYATALLHALDQADVPWIQFHPEYGPSQFELSFSPDHPLKAADLLIRARLVVQRVTRTFGWMASFSPKPRLDSVGNGGHVHFSVRDEEGPLLENGQGPAGLRPRGEALIAGLLHRLPSLVALASPSPVSFLRLVPSTWSAPFQVWGIENREAALRLIPSAPNHCPAHLEVKAVDPTTNPYLLLGALQALVIDAVANPLPLPDPCVGDPATCVNSSDLQRLPDTLAEARQAFEADDVLLNAMGLVLHGSLLDSMTAEIKRVEDFTAQQQVDDLCWWPVVGGYWPRSDHSAVGVTGSLNK